jgi:hypothetical protein
MTRTQVRARLQAELEAWTLDVPGEATVEAVDELEQAVLEACDRCRDEIAEGEA